MADIVISEDPEMSEPEQVKKYIRETAILGPNERSLQLDRYYAIYKGEQYKHQKLDWWGLSADQMETVSPDVMIPYGFHQISSMVGTVREKRPTSPFGLARGIIDRFTGMLFSDFRRPNIVVENDLDTEDFLEAVREQTTFWSKLREARTMGGSMGSVLITVRVDDGKFSLEVHNPAHTSVIWKDQNTHTPLAVFKQYLYKVTEKTFDEKTGLFAGTRQVDYVYRRIITEVDDTIFKPIKYVPNQDPMDIKWEVDSSVTHNLGFFPGVWVQNLPAVDEEDGVPDCAGVWNHFDTIDRLTSQMNKGLLLNMDPTVVIKLSRQDAAAVGQIYKGSDHSLSVGEKGDAKYLEINGAGITAGETFYKMLKQEVLDVTRCVMADPANVSGSAQSARAIEFLYGPMIDKADELRGQYGDKCILPLMQVILKIAQKFTSTETKLEDGTVVKSMFNLPPKIIGEEGNTQTIERKLGKGGHILIKWGKYFAPSEDDNQITINNAIMALQGGLIDRNTAITSVQKIFQIRDVETMVSKVEKDLEEKRKQDLEAAKALKPEPATPGKVEPKDPKSAEMKDSTAGFGGKA